MRLEVTALSRNQRFYLLPGVTYSQRSTSAYNANCSLLTAFSVRVDMACSSGEQQTLLVLAILVCTNH